jgi:ribonuclease HI
VNGMTDWIVQWEKKKWQVDVQNLDLFREIHTMLAERSGEVRFEWVKAHAGDAANEAADALAREGARKSQRNAS